MTQYTSQEITVDAVQWTGANLDEVREFAGTDFIAAEPADHLWVFNASGPFQVHPGYWLTREGDSPMVVTSPAAWERHRFTRA